MSRRRSTIKPAAFASEAELCATFLAAVADNGGWTAYAETCGWDILLVRKTDGFQIGIQAKLRLNLDVVSQSLEDHGASGADQPSPDCRAVLVPWGRNNGARICKYIGLTVIEVKPERASPREIGFRPRLPGAKAKTAADETWHEWAPSRRHTLPDYVPDVRAGASAPLRLTDWKISAIKIAVTLDHRGFVTRADFKHIGIDHRRWLSAETGWLRNDNGRFVRGKAMPDFRAQHPRVYDEISAERNVWILRD